VAARLDNLEAALGNARASLIADYARWTCALDDLESAWSLVAWPAEADEPLETAARLAA
jgi:hypothetical protein